MQTAPDQATSAEPAPVNDEPPTVHGMYCYQCMCRVSYLFADGRCSACTRIDPDCNKVPENSHIKYCNACHCITNELFCGGPDRGVCARCHASGA